MKLKIDFITNSSSTAYIIQNTSDKKLTLADFALENIYLFDDFMEQYDYFKDSRYTTINFLESAANEGLEFEPGEEQYCTFGDEDGTIVGNVYDYILRDGGESKNFIWEYRESLR
jgi:hypothetical protein